MSEYTFYVTVERGAEDLVAKDLLENFRGIEILREKEFRGKVFFRGREEHIFLMNFSARSINRLILVLLHTRNIGSLNLIYKHIKEIEWSSYIDAEQTFAVKATRVGSHNFTSLDIARVSGSAIIEAFQEETGRRLRVNLSKPDVVVHVEMINDHLLVGIDTTGPSLHMRRYRVYNHPMPLKTTLAYLLVRLSGWNPNEEKLLDPMCGGGTIPIEAALWARNIPINRFRKNEYLFYNLKFLHLEKAEKIAKQLLSKETRKELHLLGMDISEEHIKGARMNAKNALVADTIIFTQGDARLLDKQFSSESINVIVTNPPYNLRPRLKLYDLYEKFLAAAWKILADRGRMVIITSERKLLIRILRNINAHFQLYNVFRYGSLNTGIFLIEKHS